MNKSNQFNTSLTLHKHGRHVYRISTQPVRVTGQQRPCLDIIYDSVSIPQAPTPPTWSAYPYHVPLPQIPDS